MVLLGLWHIAHAREPADNISSCAYGGVYGGAYDDGIVIFLLFVEFSSFSFRIFLLLGDAFKAFLARLIDFYCALNECVCVCVCVCFNIYFIYICILFKGCCTRSCF